MSALAQPSSSRLLRLAAVSSAAALVCGLRAHFSLHGTPAETTAVEVLEVEWRPQTDLPGLESSAEPETTKCAGFEWLSDRPDEPTVFAAGRSQTYLLSDPSKAVFHTSWWSDFYGPEHAEYFAIVEGDECQRLPGSIPPKLITWRSFSSDERHVLFGGSMMANEPAAVVWSRTEARITGEFRAYRSGVSFFNNETLVRSTNCGLSCHSMGFYELDGTPLAEFGGSWIIQSEEDDLIGVAAHGGYLALHANGTGELLGTARALHPSRFPRTMEFADDALVATFDSDHGVQEVRIEVPVTRIEEP